jgi:succinoglycan biosynthesis protein ExoA
MLVSTGGGTGGGTDAGISARSATSASSGATGGPAYHGPVDASVIVPVLNEARHLREVAASMRAQTFQGELEFLFIDGGSTDGSREIISELANRDHRVRLLDNPERTTPRALNVGLQAATGEFVARMDAHARYGPNYIADGVARLKRGDVVSVSGPQLAVGYDAWSRRVALALGSRLGTGGARFRHDADEEFEVDSGFTGIWRRSVLLANGGWDDDWVGDEDFEMAARLRKAGGRIVCIPEMAAHYAPRNNLASLARQYWAYGRARVRTSRRHPESLRPSHVVPSALVFTLILAGVSRPPLARPARAVLLLYLAAMAAESVRAVRSGARPSDAAAMPIVFLVMHLSFGLGEFSGLLSYGVPGAALVQVQRKLARRAWPVAAGTRA